MRRATPLFALLGASFLLAGPARASSTYPAEIQKQLSLSYVPQCSICHANGVTGYGTVTTTFGSYMRSRGLVCCSLMSLDSALAAAEGEDSTYHYVTYLKEGLDPNNPGAGAVAQPTYGCFSVTGQGRSAGAAGVVALLVLLSAVLHRRSDRHPTL